MKEKIRGLFEPKIGLEEADYISYLEKENKALTELKDRAIELHKDSKDEVKHIKSEILKARTIKSLKETLGIK